MSYRKGKFYPRTDHECLEGECRCSCTLSLTSALDGVDVQRHALAALLPGKRPVPILWEAIKVPTFVLITSTTLFIFKIFFMSNSLICRSQWPHGLRCRSAAARLLRLWVRILRLDEMLINCEDINSVIIYCFFHFVFLFTSSYMLPRLFRFYLMHFIYCHVFLGISVLVFMPQNIKQGFYSAILC